MPLFLDGNIVESPNDFLTMLNTISFDCKYAHLGCAHDEKCLKRKNREQTENCGYFKYFVYLETTDFKQQVKDQSKNNQ